MELIQCSETSAISTETPGKHTKEIIFQEMKSFIYPTDVQLDCSKMLKFTLKFTREVLLHVSVFHKHHQGATICALLKLIG
jgi:hypothetical protein